MGVDWRFPLDQAWSSLTFQGAGYRWNLDPVAALCRAERTARAYRCLFLRQAGGRPGHIFNFGAWNFARNAGGNVRALVNLLENKRSYSAGAAHELYAMSGPNQLSCSCPRQPRVACRYPEFMKHITGGRPVSEAVMKKKSHIAIRSSENLP